MKKLLALIFAVSTLFLAGCCTTHEHASQWEYKTADSIAEVNKAAADGWVVAGFSTHISTSTLEKDGTTYNGIGEEYLLKRLKQ